jgi:hypothetical protein
MRDDRAALSRHSVIYQISDLFILKIEISFANSPADIVGEQATTAGDLLKIPKNAPIGSGRKVWTLPALSGFLSFHFSGM